MITGTTSTRRAARAFVLGVVLSVPLVLAAGTSANATNWGSIACSGTPRNCVSLANNQTHAIRFDNLGNNVTGIDDAVIWSLNNNYDPTDMTAYRDESDTLPDVWVSDNNYGALNGVVAWAECPTANTGVGGSHPTMWCRGQFVRFNSYYNLGYYNTGIERQQLACHELGHTVGLRHRTSTASCMYTYAGGGADDILDGHDVAHINARY